MFPITFCLRPISTENPYLRGKLTYKECKKGDFFGGRNIIDIITFNDKHSNSGETPKICIEMVSLVSPSSYTG